MLLCRIMNTVNVIINIPQRNKIEDFIKIILAKLNIRTSFKPKMTLKTGYMMGIKWSGLKYCVVHVTRFK